MQNIHTMSDWDIIVACLSPTQKTIDIGAEASLAARLLCDGQGQLMLADLDPIDNYPASDWSHVRDSSEPALRTCAAYLRQHLEMSDLVDRANEALSRGDMKAYHNTLETIKRMGR